MTKLNSKLDCERPAGSQVSNHLVEFLSTISASFDINPHNIPDAKQLKKLLDDFYTHQYEQLNLSGALNRPDVKISQSLSTQEAAIINYFLGDILTTKPFVLLGHAGVGKSTLLKFIAYYLYANNPDLQRLCYPVYISLSDYSSRLESIRKQTDVRVDEFYDLLDDAIFRGTRKNIKRYLLKECDASKVYEILTWASEEVDELFGKLTESARNTAASDIDVYISSLAPGEIKQLFLGVLRYRVVNDEIRTIFFIDNIDRFDIDIHYDCLGYADRMQNLGFHSVLAMRYSTYTYIDHMISEKTDNISRLCYSSDTVKQVLLKRIAHTEQKVKLNFGYTMDAEMKDVVSAFSRLLMSGECLETLVSLSNGSLDKLFGKLRMMAGSVYLDDDLLAKELIQSKIDDRYRSKGIPIWIMYSMLLGNCAGAFKSSKLPKTGIINLFCNQSYNHSPYTFFSRIHLLARLVGMTESRDENFLLASTWMDEYRDLFGTDMNFHATFYRTALRLIQEGLVHTRSCIRYADENQLQKQLIPSDSVAISPAGLFYIQTLMMKIEYVYFMKDDIRWATRDIPFHLSTPTDTITTKFKATLQALQIIYQYELHMLLRLSEEAGRNEKNLVQLYVDNYSPVKALPDWRSPLYTKCIFSKTKEHMESVAPGIIDHLQESHAIDLSEFAEISDVERSYSVF